MTIWQRIKAWIARPDPDDKDSDFLRTTGIAFDAQGLEKAPGEDTHRLHVRQLQKHFGLDTIKRTRGSPSAWDRLNEERKQLSNDSQPPKGKP